MIGHVTLGATFVWTGLYRSLFCIVDRNGWIETICLLCPKTKALINVLSHPWRKHL